LESREDEDHPDKSGLVVDAKISNTPAGDETLELAHDGALFPSIGFAARGGDHRLDRRTMTRRINRAHLDHLSLVPQPAYDGARVESMRSGTQLETSNRLEVSILQLIDDPLFTWAQQRTAEANQRARHASSEAEIADWQSYSQRLTRR
jgi:phage head maturation protease